MDYKENIIKKAELLKAISNPIRLCLVKKLTEEDKLNVTYFTNCMDASQSTISQHLGKLRDLRILDCEKDGKNVNYYIKNEEVRNIIKVLFEESLNE
ncbi:MAG: ArsR/SmtB family transcription factor [Peptoniphilaceae bacterium]